MKTIVIDASGAVLGRLASYAAKQALLGKQVSIVHCEHAIVAGKKSNIIEEYRIAYARGGSSLKGPFLHKKTDKLLKRTIRGMLSYQQGRGRDAFKRIKCYNGVPKEFESAEKITLVRPLKTKSIKLSELVKSL